MSIPQASFASPSCPTEILSRIFEFSLDGPLQLHGNSPGLPSSLTATCRRWREVALTSPRIWSSVYVDYDESDEPEPRSLLTKQHSERLLLFQTWLARSKSAPIFCRLSGGQLSKTIQVDFMTYLGCLLLHADHWCDIEIVMIGDLESSSLNPANYRNYPGAQRHSLVVPRDFSSSPVMHLGLYWNSYIDCSAFEHAFEVAANLRTLRLKAPHLTRWCFPWSQLTALCIGEVIDDDHPVPLDFPWLLRTLSQCISLEFLSITAQDAYPCLPIPTAEHISLYKVREVHFDSWDVDVLDLLLRVMSFPSIRKLSFVEVTREPLPSAGESLMSLVSSHAATLQDLVTNRIGLSNRNLLRCYRSAVNLSHINLVGLLRTHNASEILQGLVLRFRDDGTLLEGQNIQLQKLTLFFGVSDDPDDPTTHLPMAYNIVSRMEDLVGPLLDIITSRWNLPLNASDGAVPVARLTTLHVEPQAMSWMKQRDPERYGFMMQIVGEGLTLIDEVTVDGIWPDLPE